MVLWGNSDAISEFTVCFHDNEIGAYFPGQTVSVRVNIVWTKPFEIRGIRLKVDGSAHAQWWEDKNREYQKFTQTETFINEIKTLWGKGNTEDGPNQIINPGSYEFISSFVVPTNCPPNFEGEHGWIRYSCKALVDIPWHCDEERVVGFTVLSTVDLNKIPRAIDPQVQQQSKELQCIFGFCCGSGMIECTATIHRTGFVPGEAVVINGIIDNRSTKSIEQITVSLLKVVQFKAEQQSRYVKTEITSFIKGSIEAGGSQAWRNELLTIPDTQTSITNCTTIQLVYLLQISIMTNGCYSNFEIDFPIIIGNIRLRFDLWRETSVSGNVYNQLTDV